MEDILQSDVSADRKYLRGAVGYADSRLLVGLSNADGVLTGAPDASLRRVYVPAVDIERREFPARSDCGTYYGSNTDTRVVFDIPQTDDEFADRRRTERLKKHKGENKSVDKNYQT